MIGIEATLFCPPNKFDKETQKYLYDPRTETGLKLKF